jgi:hypothetical protein
MKMQEVTQLKTIRDEALARLKNNPDYKLMTSLDSLIIELEGVSALANFAENNVVVTDKPQTLGSSKKLEKDTKAIDEAFEKLVTPKNQNGAGTIELADEINGGVTLS